MCRKVGRMAASSIPRRQEIPTLNEARDRKVIVVAKNAAEAARKTDAKRVRGSEVVRPNAKT
jgi:hypothetical protein